MARKKDLKACSFVKELVLIARKKPDESPHPLRALLLVVCSTAVSKSALVSDSLGMSLLLKYSKFLLRPTVFVENFLLDLCNKDLYSCDFGSIALLTMLRMLPQEIL